MAKSQTLVALAAANLKIAALEARLTLATQTWRDQRSRIVELEAQLNTRGVIAHNIAPVITHFTKADGSVWEKTRIGNRASSHQVLSNQEHWS